MTAAEEPRGEPRDQQRTEVDSARERLIFLSDGVFAIAITLLVLEITLPQLPGGFMRQEQDLPSKLFALWPQIATYALSFMIVSVYWTTHQRVFHYITRVDNILTWLNILFLLSVAFLPVPTNVLGRYGEHGAAVRFYAVCLMVTGLIILALWWYATSDHRLVDKQLDAALIRHHQERALIGLVVLVLCIGLSYLNPYLAEASLLLIGAGIFVHEWLYRRRASS